MRIFLWLWNRLKWTLNDSTSKQDHFRLDGLSLKCFINTWNCCQRVTLTKSLGFAERSKDRKRVPYVRISCLTRKSFWIWMIFVHVWIGLTGDYIPYNYLRLKETQSSQVVVKICYIFTNSCFLIIDDNNNIIIKYNEGRNQSESRLAPVFSLRLFPTSFTSAADHHRTRHGLMIKLV